ncbi:hypothetical protein OsJ_06365 [Oryza sativa Japonica Group]|nr:hypothetical protein OsJ_06365 [Oryza sativa Japonica Group]
MAQRRRGTADRAASWGRTVRSSACTRPREETERPPAMSFGDSGGRLEGETRRWQQVLSPWAAAMGEELAGRSPLRRLAERSPRRTRRRRGGEE